jgi:uncharacterized membrane protein YdjX (TVP38/TMEM64 family)
VWKRVLLLVLLLGVAATVWLTGAYEYANVDSVRAAVEGAGFWGPVLFVLLFGLEGLGIVPGLLFMLTAIVLWPPGQALILNWLGALMAGIVGFTYARTLGREFIAARLPERIRRFERRVVERSLRTVIVIRLAFFISPPAHWALGLSPVSFGNFVLGSAIGNVPWVLGITLLGAPLLDWFANQSREMWLNLALTVLLALLAWRIWRRQEGRP